MTDDFPIEYYDYIIFYQDNVQPQLEKKGEAYVELVISELSLEKQLNYLKETYNLKIIWFEKPDDAECICIFIKANKK